MARSESLFLAGSSRGGERALDVRSPWDGQVVATVAAAGPREIALAIDRAAEAVPLCAALAPHARAAILERAATLVSARSREIADLLVEEAGKPVTSARAEVARACDTLREAAHVARHPPVLARDLGGYESGAKSLALIRRVPIGPVLAITPFNFPLNLVAHKVAPAIAAGCPIVVKPASQTPSPALALARALAEAGLPDGALSVLPCRGADAAPLVDEPRFRLVTFTGSSEVGWALKEKAWDRRVTLELGGNAAVIVDEDARALGDLRTLARRITRGAFAFAGQSCIAVQRILVHEALVAPLREALVAETNDTPSGDPRDERTVSGPLIDEANADRVESWIESAVRAGGRLLCGGERERTVIRPALLEHVPHAEPLVSDEVFGPVAVLEPFAAFEEALASVNDSRYGLQAGVFTASVARARQAWEVLEVGGVIHNDVPTWRTDPMPYGGVKRSGIGREGPEFAYLEMTEERLLVLR